MHCGAGGIRWARRLRLLFLDCSGFDCGPDSYRTDIAFVDDVRERSAVDVHVLIMRQSTGGGRFAFGLAFYGQQWFAGVSDTLALTTPQGATEDAHRRALSRTVKLGLARYVARTPGATRASLTLAPAHTTAQPTTAPHGDPLNALVFRIGANLNASRERDFPHPPLPAARHDLPRLWFAGINYTFGSVLNNVVNPRFSGAMSEF